MSFDWKSLLSKLVLVPYIVAGIESIHSEKDTATKTQMAKDALGLATATADAVDPAEQPLVDASSAVVNHAIEQFTQALAATKATSSSAPPA